MMRWGTLTARVAGALNRRSFADARLHPALSVEYCVECNYAPRFEILEKTFAEAYPMIPIKALTQSKRAGSFEVTLHLEDRDVEIWSKLFTAMSGIKSALTAALDGVSKVLKPEGSVTADAAAFPCLNEKGASTSVDKTSEAFEDLNLKDASYVGSAPTVIKANTADYLVSRSSMRSGKEISVGSVHGAVLMYMVQHAHVIECTMGFWYGLVGRGRRSVAWPDAFLVRLCWAPICGSADGLSRGAANLLTEEVIGSLPKAMSVREREAVFANTPLSPTMNLVSSLPSDKLEARSGAARKLRRSVLRGAVIVFITAGYSGKRFIFERAKELGVRSVIIDGPDSWAKELEENGTIARFVGLDMSDAESVFDRAVEAMKKVKRDLGELDGVISFAEMAMPLVARLAEALGLPGNPASCVDAARDKHATRRCMSEAGLPTPNNYLITDASQLAEASAHVGYPSVIKPIFGAASIGVVRVDDEASLRAAYERVVKDLKGARIVAGALEQGDGGEEAGNASSWIRTDIMMEQYLDGPEVDVDIVMSEGRAVYGAITDNWPTQEPYFNETGSNAPSALPAAHQRELLDLSIRSVQALGFQMGVFHVECKYTRQGARLIEVNCRMGGGPVRTINLRVWGVDLVEEALLLCAGIPSRPSVAPAPMDHIGEFFVNALATGTLEDDKFVEQFKDWPDMVYIKTLVPVGSKVTCVEDGLPTWVCEFMVSRPTVEEAIQRCKEVEQAVQKVMPIKKL
ncbi:ATP-grasp domain-containing protein [Helicosporidium sp. ATCC 50920]|nr:ATP-grasp domain-containing protein [Helicosporidium sp. ATCC 50920]|eukprot:KDD77180.1 ATP-grasp domain-containing protein [Helicosporidium sp. ATCC 50920]